MNFIMDVFFEFLAMLLGLIGILCAFGGVLIAIVGFALNVEFVADLLSGVALPSYFGWILGLMVLIVGILLMSLSSVMRKRIGRR